MKSVIALKLVIILSCIYFFFQSELEALKAYSNFRSLANFTLSNEQPIFRNSYTPPTSIHNSSDTHSLKLALQKLHLQNQILRDDLKKAQDTIQQLRNSGAGAGAGAGISASDSFTTTSSPATNTADQQQVASSPPATADPAPSATTAPSARGGNCALLFFGVPRIFRQVALPSIRQHLLLPNKGCDVFVHSYNITSLHVNRNGEHGPLNPADLYELTPNVVLETIDSFEAKRQDVMPFFQEHHHTGWGTFDSTANMMKAWHSIESVWNMMEENQRQNNLSYNRVGIFRMDMYYPHPIFIGDPNEPAVIPDFGWDNQKIRNNYPGHFLNDRGIYGEYQYTRIWATQRFAFAQEYAAKHQQQGLSPPIAFRNGLTGVHSESLLTEMVQRYQIPIIQKEICFYRLRAGGLIRTGDCGGNPHNYLQEIEFNRQTLQGQRCAGPLFKSPPGPCVG